MNAAGRNRRRASNLRAASGHDLCNDDVRSPALYCNNNEVMAFHRRETMKKIIKATAAMAAAGLSLGLIAGCGSGDSNADKGHVYFLSMKVEQADQIRELADNFTA